MRTPVCIFVWQAIIWEFASVCIFWQGMCFRVYSCVSVCIFVCICLWLQKRKVSVCIFCKACPCVFLLAMCIFPRVYPCVSVCIFCFSVCIRVHFLLPRVHFVTACIPQACLTKGHKISPQMNQNLMNNCAGQKIHQNWGLEWDQKLGSLSGAQFTANCKLRFNRLIRWLAC